MKVGNFSSILPRAKQRPKKQPGSHPHSHTAIPLQPQQAQHVLEYKDHPTPRHSSLPYLPLLNVLWLLVLSISLGIYILTGPAQPAESPQQIRERIDQVTKGKEELQRFTFTPKDGLLTMDVPLPSDLSLRDVFTYNVCCRHRGDFVCRLGTTRSMGIDCVLRQVKKETGNSLNHTGKQRVIASVVAEHPNMMGAICWIIYQIKEEH